MLRNLFYCHANFEKLEVLSVVSEKSQISQILAAIMNFGCNGNCHLSQKPLEIEHF